MNVLREGAANVAEYNTVTMVLYTVENLSEQAYMWISSIDPE